MLLSHFGDFDCDSTCELYIFLCSTSPHIRSGVANEQKFFNLFKNFSIRSAVSVGLLCIRPQIDGDCTANPRRLQCDPRKSQKTALRIISSLKRHCSKSILLKKWELLEEKKRWPEVFPQFLLFTKIRFDSFDSLPLANLHFAILWNHKKHNFAKILAE